MPYKYCQHVKENGIYCNNGALQGRKYCYFHLRSRARRLAMAQAASQRKPWRLDLPPLENLHAVQVAIMQVVEALAAGAIEGHSAGLMLYGLQQAASNVRAFSAWRLPSAFALRPDADNRALNYPGLETEFDLPKRIDLDARPEALFPPPATPPDITPQEALLVLGKVLDLPVSGDLGAVVDAARTLDAAPQETDDYAPLATPLSPIPRLLGDPELSDSPDVDVACSGAALDRAGRLLEEYESSGDSGAPLKPAVGVRGSKKKKPPRRTGA